MRELKFRIWQPTKNYIYFGLSKGNSFTFETTPHIEQYTGLKDKNGKEIYEGDILGGIYEHGYIAYCDKCKQLQFFDADMGCMMCIGDICWRDIVESERYGELNGELEVIGNIHENPELLEDEE